MFIDCGDPRRAIILISNLICLELNHVVGQAGWAARAAAMWSGEGNSSLGLQNNKKKHKSETLIRSSH